jgi:hypothetical protein
VGDLQRELVVARGESDRLLPALLAKQVEVAQSAEELVRSREEAA